MLFLSIARVFPAASALSWQSYIPSSIFSVPSVSFARFDVSLQVTFVSVQSVIRSPVISVPKLEEVDVRCDSGQEGF